MHLIKKRSAFHLVAFGSCTFACVDEERLRTLPTLSLIITANGLSSAGHSECRCITLRLWSAAAHVIRQPNTSPASKTLTRTCGHNWCDDGYCFNCRTMLPAAVVGGECTTCIIAHTGKRQERECNVHVQGSFDAFRRQTPKENLLCNTFAAISRRGASLV